jgi:hypothetical protein
MTALERAFLTRLAGEPQGRTSYALVDRDGALAIVNGLVASGYIRHRRLGFDPGFQITDLGRSYLGGSND